MSGLSALSRSRGVLIQKWKNTGLVCALIIVGGYRDVETYFNIAFQLHNTADGLPGLLCDRSPVFFQHNYRENEGITESNINQKTKTQKWGRQRSDFYILQLICDVIQVLF